MSAWQTTFRVVHDCKAVKILGADQKIKRAFLHATGGTVEGLAMIDGQCMRMNDLTIRGGSIIRVEYENA